MERKERIALEKEASGCRDIQVKRIQELYESYMRLSSGDRREQEVITELIRETERFCMPTLRRMLASLGLGYGDIDQDVSQEVILKILRLITSYREKKDFRSSIAYEFRMMYKYGATDYYRTHKKELLNSSIYGDDQAGVIDTLEGSDPNIRERETEENVDEKLLYIYCDCFMTDQSDIRRSLALCYARFLSHIKELIPGTKPASPKAARLMMGNQSIRMLVSNSESLLQSCISERLLWSDEKRECLEMVETIKDQSVSVGDIIFAENYDDKRISKWAKDEHVIVLKEAIERVMEDPIFYEAVGNVYSRRSFIYQMILKEGREK